MAACQVGRSAQNYHLAGIASWQSPVEESMGCGKHQSCNLGSVPSVSGAPGQSHNRFHFLINEMGLSPPHTRGVEQGNGRERATSGPLC